jgi:D-glycero-alpha-D-manno-heptose-7-phosphate kinase
VCLVSQDIGTQEQHASLDAMELGGELDLIKRALRFYRPGCGVDISTLSGAPQGSGLGSSSALLMALSCGLNEIGHLGLGRERIIDVGANIEAQTIGIPTGKQDYFPPLFGGVSAIWFDVEGFRHEDLSADNDLIDALNERLILSFTNISRFSALTNWAMLKRYVEREGDTVERIRQIKAVAMAMKESLVTLDLDRFADLLRLEWESRKGLAEGVTTPEIDAMMAAAAQAGAGASKLCGAGGGGCMISYAEPQDRVAVKQALAQAGATVMDFRIVRDAVTMCGPAGESERRMQPGRSQRRRLLA